SPGGGTPKPRPLPPPRGSPARAPRGPPALPRSPTTGGGGAAPGVGGPAGLFLVHHQREAGDGNAVGCARQPPRFHAGLGIIMIAVNVGDARDLRQVA